jgi:steroid 5-alpha reductase family enzyme
MSALIASWGIALTTAGILAVVWFAISVWRKRNDVADIGWGTYFIAIAIVSFLSHNPAWSLRIIPIILVVIWGVRLSSHIFKRHLRTPEDARYLAWRKEWGNGAYFYIRSFLQVFLLQAFLATLISLPVIIVTASYFKPNLGFLIAGIIVWIFGFVFESTADNQLKKFISNPENRGHIMQTGLWKYSRHPNYFGEVTQWWGLFIVGLGVPLGIFGIIGPVVITLLIVFVSGIPLAEKNMKGNPEFESYKAKTSSLFPLPPKQ